MIKKTSYENVSHCSLEPNVSLKAAIILKYMLCRIKNSFLIKYMKYKNMCLFLFVYFPIIYTVELMFTVISMSPALSRLPVNRTRN